MSSLRYYITADDLKHVKNFPVYHVVQADYLEGYKPNKGICTARDFMYGVFIKELRPYCNRKWVAEELDRVNNEIYDIVKALEDKFPYLFKDKRKYGKGWYERKMARMLLEGRVVVDGLSYEEILARQEEENKAKKEALLAKKKEEEELIRLKEEERVKKLAEADACRK